VPDQPDDSAPLQPGMAVRASSFQLLLEYITRYCEWVLPGQAMATSNPEIVRKHPRVALTFDDGWKDNFEIAFPISQKCGVLFTVFICPQMITRSLVFWTSRVNSLWWTARRAGKLDLLPQLSGTRAPDSAAAVIEGLKRVNPEEREAWIVQLQAALKPYAEEENAAVNREQLLTWSEIRKMASAGIAFGSHTNTHPILTAIPPSDVVQELRDSKNAIEAELRICPWFAYPNGDWSPAVRDVVAQSGYQAAFANSPGIWQGNSNRFSIPRINLWEGSLAGLSGRFSRIALEYAIFWKAHRVRS
jgi:peptidoglycan/xylan/chitin deacetylase (PgdA/CDA1 family)